MQATKCFPNKGSQRKVLHASSIIFPFRTFVGLIIICPLAYLINRDGYTASETVRGSCAQVPSTF